MLNFECRRECLRFDLSDGHVRWRELEMFALAEELGVNVFYAGHYATETFGVKALAEHLSRKFRVDWEFVDHPTGL